MPRHLPLAILALLLTAVAASGDSSDAVKYKIIRLDDKVVQTTREVNGKKTLYLTIKFRLEKANGKPAGDVRKEEIHIKEDGKPVTDLEISQPRSVEPLTVVIVTDTSGSMNDPADKDDKEPKIEALRKAAGAFVKDMPEGARLTLLPFNSTVSRPEAFTDRKDHIVSRVNGLKASGETALFDAVLTAVQTLEAAKLPGRWAVVALTDGIDNSSRHRVEEAISRAREANVPLYMLGFGPEGEFDKKVMERMASDTDGKFFHARSAEELRLHFRTLVEEFQPTYTVTFADLRQTYDGLARDITVEIEQDGRSVSKVYVEKDGKLVSAGGESIGQVQLHGVVVPIMNRAIYLVLLVLIGLLLALPAGVKRLYRSTGGT
jgi:VWFA-related protein